MYSKISLGSEVVHTLLIVLTDWNIFNFKSCLGKGYLFDELNKGKSLMPDREN
jgi:hypothetical protein